tara:strand:- start:11 stop:946 length:936 start_codon:yes stop_codon:yes gene_type:complete
MSKFGRIDYSETSFGEITFNKNQTLTSASEGVHLVHAIKDQTSENIPWKDGGALTVTGSHWAFIHNMFYLSGSTKVSTDSPADSEKFNWIYHKFGEFHWSKPFFNTKLYNSASIIYIPQQNFGERIKSGSFQLTARTGSSTNTTKEIIIKDDGNGNLYSTNAEYSQSVGSLSSSDNYIGNIYYDLGVATLTETASWSGSVNYTDIGRIDSTTEQTYKYWDLRFNSTLPIYTSEYSLQIKGGEFNSTMNETAIGTGSADLLTTLTSSGWSPYFNQVQLYDKQSNEPAIIANLPRAVKTRDDVDIIISFRMDH